ncbi:ABC transporter ATP-binding protein [Marinifilum sp. JC120]|nr:ABC transporter ATP-binding protein [Marinifilum sp. JC120]
MGSPHGDHRMDPAGRHCMRQGLKMILGLVPELKQKLLVVLLGKIIETIIGAVPLVVLIAIMTALFKGTATTETIIFYSGIMLVCALLYWGTTFVSLRISWPLGTLLSTRMRLLIGEHIRKLPMGWFQGRSTGASLNSLVSDEMQMIQMIPSYILPSLVPVFFIPAALLLFLPWLDWRLSLMLVAVIPPAILFFVRGQKAHAKGFNGRSKSLARMTSDTLEYIQGMEALKAFQHVGSGFKRLDSSMRQFHKDSLKSIIPGITPGFAFLTCLDLGTPLVLTGATLFYLEGSLSLETFLIFILLAPRIHDPLRQLLGASGMYRFAEPGLVAVKEILEQKPLPEPHIEKAPEGHEIKFKNATFSYHDRKILDNVSFTVPEGKITALVGPSGAGKTTITNLIARFWNVDSGTISIGGRDVKQIPQKILMDNLSMVFQDVYLFNDTIYNNIAFGAPEAGREEIINAAKTAYCHEFIMGLPEGYDTIVGERGDRLSGGERQRISIARAILKDAPVILLDEATASVDPENEALIQAALAGLVQSKTLLIIAHRLSTITSADQIIVLDGKGGIAETGNHQTLMQSEGLYKRFWKSREKAESWSIKEKSK